jgi:hypothetical protein
MKDRTACIFTLVVLFVSLFFIALARGGVPVVKDDPCAILREEQTSGGSWLQWCDLDGDKQPEIVQEVIKGVDGAWYYIDILSVDSERLGAYQGAN